MLAKHVAFLRERRWLDELRYPWQTREYQKKSFRPARRNIEVEGRRREIMGTSGKEAFRCVGYWLFLD